MSRGVVCPQGVGGEHWESHSRYNLSISDDCLRLDILTPHNYCTMKLPVLVLLHGGDFKHGSGADFGLYGLFNNVVLRGHVVVTLNYRINSFGAWYSLTGTSSNPPSSRLLSSRTVQLWLLQAELRRQPSPDGHLTGAKVDQAAHQQLRW